MNISVIIPVHEFDEKIDAYLTRSIDSIEKQENNDNDLPEIFIVYASKLDENNEFKKFKNLERKKIGSIKFIPNENKTDFQSQINLGVKHIKSDYFCILEFDDELSTTYFKHANIHINNLKDVDLFLSLIVETDDNNNALKLTNETVWSKQFVGENGELGYLNVNALQQYTDFKISGAIFKKSEYEAVGGLKSNIKLTFTLELLLRLLNNGNNIYSIPKIGVKHLATREGSLFHTYSKTMSPAERKFWFNVAKKECNFFSDRIIDLSPITT